MKEINPLTIDENTPPSFETERAKWWLIDIGDKYAIWRVDAKKSDEKVYVIQRKSDGMIVGESQQLEAVYIKHDLLEKFY